MEREERLSSQKKMTFVELEPLPPKLKHLREDKRHRIVETEAAKKVQEAPKNAYLGFQNQIVDQETISRNRRIVTGIRGSVKTKTEPTDLSQLGVFKLTIPKPPAPDQPEWATPGVRPEDYVEGVKEGEHTALNTQEYVYYSYFQRIRERLDRAWVPLLRSRLQTYYQAGRKLASDMDHTTKVLVVLNDKGEVVRVLMLEESGTRELDDAAVRSFNDAGPFPNPPKGIIDSNREVKIPWHFILRT